MSELQTAITNLQVKHAALVSAVRGYPGSAAGRTNESLTPAMSAQWQVKERVASLRRQIEADGQSLILDWENDVCLVNGEAKRLEDVVEFTRASGGGRFGPGGKYEWIPAARTNIFTQSGEYSSWTMNEGATRSIVETILPDGTLGAASLLDLSSAVNARASRTLADRGKDRPLCYSVYVKALPGESGVWSTALRRGSDRVKSAYIDSGGWTRMSVVHTGTAANFAVYPGFRQVGDTITRALVAFSQLEVASQPSDYIPTDGTPVSVPSNQPRIDYDPFTGACLGLLLEEQRTNLESYSNSILQWSEITTTPTETLRGRTVNAALAPDGTMSATKIIASTGYDAQRTYRGFSGTSGLHTFSFYVKTAGVPAVLIKTSGSTNAALDLATGEFILNSNGAIAHAVGDGWYRLCLTFDASWNNVPWIAMANQAGSYSFVGDGVMGIYIWGVQVESGGFATSLIPTSGEAVTRAGDTATVRTLDWYNPEQFTLFSKYTPLGSNQFYPWTYWHKGGIRSLGYKAANSFAVLAGPNSAGLVVGPIHTPIKGAVGVGSNGSLTLSANGEISEKGISPSREFRGVPDSPRGIRIGRTNGSVTAQAGHIGRLEYYPRALSSETLQELTSQ